MFADRYGPATSTASALAQDAHVPISDLALAINPRTAEGFERAKPPTLVALVSPDSPLHKK
jgi:hypothetical protein